VILLDLGVFVVDVQARGDPVGDDSGTERAGGGLLAAAVDPPVEDEADLVGAPGVEVVADDLFEEHPPGHRAVQHLGQGELSLQHRALVAVARGSVGLGERVGHDRQPLVQQRLDLGRAQPVAELLERIGVGAGGEPHSSAVNAIPAWVAWRLAHSWPLMHSLAL
jgi:hypothetical protein